MSRYVKVVHIDQDVEEEVVVDIDGHLLTCFANVCPYAIAVGQSYPATLSLWAADGVVLREAGHETPGIFRMGDGFRHKVVGSLRGTVLDAGVCFDDEMYAREFQWLDGHLVAADVDRIEIAFE